MAGIMPALETHHDIGALRQPIDDLALAFVAPLGADDHDIGHVRKSSKPWIETHKRRACRGRVGL